MLVSVIIPACAAHTCIGAAVHSLLAQSHTRWEAVIVSDDGSDYLASLRAQGIADKRLTMVSTGSVRSGCHRARNLGLSVAQGDFITQLDADDEIRPHRLAKLLPVALEWGAAADNLELRVAETGAILCKALGNVSHTCKLGVAEIIALSTPLVPLVRRDHMLPRAEGVELAEDVIANVQLVARIGQLPVVSQSSYQYNLNIRSMSRQLGVVAQFDKAYAGYINRLLNGDGFGLPLGIRQSAGQGLHEKRQLNLAFETAQASGYQGTFHHFALLHREDAKIALVAAE